MQVFQAAAIYFIHKDYLVGIEVLSDDQYATAALFGGIAGGIAATNASTKEVKYSFWTGKATTTAQASSLSGEYLDFNIKRGYGMSYGGDEPVLINGGTLREVEVVAQYSGADALSGILEIGFTGTIAAGIGFSFEVGGAYDGSTWVPYVSLDLAWGADLSSGMVVDYHTPLQGNLSFQEAQGWSESSNLSILYGDYSWGGSSLNSGLSYDSYSKLHTLYRTNGGGVSYSPLPLGFTVNKGYTWYFF